jgi:uncharacterized lipoprotein YehR (DUF1307 family)
MKKLLTLFLTMILMFSLVACGDSDAHNTSEEKNEENYTAITEDTGDAELGSETIDTSESAEETMTSDTSEESKQDEVETAETESTDDPSDLTYSTNSLEVAKQGDSGVFSYKRAGTNYDTYWIIDFDEGCAYWFTYGNENGTCDRVQIDSGNLNEYIVVTYHDGSDTWQYGLSFKRKNQPDGLIEQHTDGEEYEFTATVLSEALEIRDLMTIVDY